MPLLYKDDSKGQDKVKKTQEGTSEHHAVEVSTSPEVSTALQMYKWFSMP